MNLFVMRGNKLIIAATVIIAFSTILGMSVSKKVFMSGNRNLPIYSVARDDNKIAITFNCAWGNEDIDLILKNLANYNCTATFFIVGDWAEKYPESLKKIYDSGHEIGMHSYNHKDYTTLNATQIQEDISKNEAAIANAIGITPSLFRCSSGAYNNTAISCIEKMNKTCIQWSIDSLDYKSQSPEDIFIRATKNASSGDIVLFHTGTKHTATALSRILNSLSGRYQFVKISDLLIDGDFFVDNTGKMIKSN